MHPCTYQLRRLASMAPADSDRGGGLAPLITPEEVSAKIRIAKQTLARWRVEGRGPAFLRVGGRVLYRPGDIETWLAGRRVHSTAEADRVT